MHRADLQPHDSAVESYEQKHRPQVHFCAPRNWLNDPNGLVWHAGHYHLFYQYNPTGNEWGNIHWGHAVSTDLVSWEQRPIALYAEPGGLGFMYSGCVVADTLNRSGLGKDGVTPLVALYTNCTKKGVQSQSVAYSLNEGETWVQYPHNPVIPNPGIRDFRDPKVFWHAPSDRWVMALAVFDRVVFYVSPNLLAWTRVSEFRREQRSIDCLWECPDLFPLRSRSGETRWILVVSERTSRDGWVTNHDGWVQYFVGCFDGRVFTPDRPEPNRLDYGADNFASVTWDGSPDGRRVMIGWMDNWRYAHATPTYPWRGHMTIPRSLRLTEDPDGHRVAMLPVKEVEQLRAQTLELEQLGVGSPELQDHLRSFDLDTIELDLEVSWHKRPRTFSVGFGNSSAESLLVSVNLDKAQLVVDRRTVGQRIRHRPFASCFVAPLTPGHDRLDIRVIKDRASVEVFADGGRVVISSNVFFDEPPTNLALHAEGDAVVNGCISTLRGIWPKGAGGEE